MEGNSRQGLSVCWLLQELGLCFRSKQGKEPGPGSNMLRGSRREIEMKHADIDLAIKAKLQ